MPLIRTNEVELFYDLTGPENAPVVAFSNSIGTTLEMWDRQVPALSDRYRCLRYDTRGHGRSQVLDQPVTIGDLADDLAGLLDALGVEKAHIVGLSLGGMTAQAFGARYPERAQSLVLMATSAYLPHGWDERAATVRAQGMGGDRERRAGALVHARVCSHAPGAGRAVARALPPAGPTRLRCLL